MKRNNSLCFFVNIAGPFFAAPAQHRHLPAQLFLSRKLYGHANRYCTNGERTIYVRAAFRKTVW
jgi:hypothetical protein